jgi:L-asparaginase/Glu-tRNA(Gln) amidotransferase subunit D
VTEFVRPASSVIPAVAPVVLIRVKTDKEDNHEVPEMRHFCHLAGSVILGGDLTGPKARILLMLTLPQVKGDLARLREYFKY